MEGINNNKKENTPKELGDLFLNNPSLFRGLIRKKDNIQVMVDLGGYNGDLNMLGRKAKAFLESGNGDRKIIFRGSFKQKQQIESNVFDSGVDFQEI